MERIKGYIDHIIFRNEDNGYSVFILETEAGEVTCVGNFASLSEGELLNVEGDYVIHSTYGTQLKVTSYEVLRPEDLVSIERYLASGAIKGVGKGLAGKIVKKFKEETFRVMEEEPERLAEIKGISERMAREIGLQVEEKKDMREGMIFLQGFGISLSLAAKIFQHYGTKIYEILRENPYVLADEIDGIGFKTADDIARHIGIEKDSDFRKESGIYYALQQSIGEGHTYLPVEVLQKRAEDMLEITITQMDSYLIRLVMDKKVVVEEKDKETRVYLSSFYKMEVEAAKILWEHNLDLTPKKIEWYLQQAEKKENLHLEEQQRKAVLEAGKHGVFLLTGGPGTGKTTTINAMIHFFEEQHKSILLAAPTGRAAKRMTQTSKVEAQTIHRMLEVQGDLEERAGRFNRNEENPLEADVIIVDEVSMVDLPLFYALLKAVPIGSHLILVGDKDQLPSVGPGCVLQDLLFCGCLPTVELTTIFRQLSDSDIVLNAHRINRGEMPVLDNKSRDFFFLERNDANTIIAVILTLLLKKLPKYVDANPLDIQVMCPMKKGLLGVERLNSILQQYVNPPSSSKEEKKYGDKLFREGDKVMQIRNDYQLPWKIQTEHGIVVQEGEGVFNGDIGQIKTISLFKESMEVVFDDNRQVEYSFKQLDELELAYAITIHKSQGSEYPAVIIPLLPGPYQLYRRNLLYTAVTRASTCVTIVGSQKTVWDMVQNQKDKERYSALAEWIKEMDEH